jgi:hypothetical protein
VFRLAKLNFLICDIAAADVWMDGWMDGRKEGTLPPPTLALQRLGKGALADITSALMLSAYNVQCDLRKCYDHNRKIILSIILVFKFPCRNKFYR